MFVCVRARARVPFFKKKSTKATDSIKDTKIKSDLNILHLPIMYVEIDRVFSLYSVPFLNH